MIPGYNQPRPKKENYEDFEKKLVEGLKGLNIEGISLMFYGSYVRGEYVPGRSDIDAVLEFPDDVVIDKLNFYNCSKVLEESLEGNNVPFQVTVSDRGIDMDGRFNSYTSDFEDYFNEEGVILLGPDMREHMKFEHQKAGDLHKLSFNLRKARLGLILSQYHLKNDYEQLLKDFGKALDITSKAPRQILYLSYPDFWKKNKFSTIGKIRSDFPEVDVEILEKIRGLYSDNEKLDKLYRNVDEMFDLWNSSLTTFEQMIRSYIGKYPKL